MADTTAIQQAVESDPQIQAILQAGRATLSKMSPTANRGAYQTAVNNIQAQIVPLLAQKGITLPKNYFVNVSDGKVGEDGWFLRNAPWLVPTILGGAAAVTGLAGAAGAGGSAAAGSTAAPAATGGAATTAGAAGPLAAGETFAAGPVAGAGLSGVDLTGMGAATGGGSLLHSLLPSIIGAGASLGGTAIASHANTEAAKIAAAQADKALAIQQQQYALQRQDTAPYRALGQGAVNNLGFLGGIDTTSNLKALSDINPTVNPPPSTGVAPGAVDASGKPLPGAPPTSSITPPTMAQQQTNNTTLSQVGSGGTVRIQDPQTGLVHLIPSSQSAAAQQAGGRLV